MQLSFELNRARKLSDRDIEEILQEYGRKVSISEMARTFSVRRSAIQYHILKSTNPKAFSEMQDRKVQRNKSYNKISARRDYLNRLRIANGHRNVIAYRKDIETRTRKKEKRQEWQRMYRAKNRTKINKNWMKNYYKKQSKLL